MVIMRCFVLRITNRESWPFERRCFLFNVERFDLFPLGLCLPTLTFVRRLGEKDLAVVSRLFGH